jgi:hypothetical protein
MCWKTRPLELLTRFPHARNVEQGGVRTMFDSPQVPAPVEPLIDSEHAAALMLIHPKTLQRYARKGLVPGVRVGKLWRFRASDIYSHFSIVGAQPLDEHA